MKISGCSFPGSAAISSRQIGTNSKSFNRDMITGGHGLQIAVQNGWPTFRTELAQMAYLEVVRAQSQQINVLKAQGITESSPSGKELIKINLAAKERALKLIDDFACRYPKSEAKDNQFFADVEKGHKLRIRGLHEAGGKRDYPLTRLYFTTQITHAPEAYILLFQEFKADNLLQYCDFTLLIETFSDPGVIFGGESTLNVSTRADVFILYLRRWPGLDVLSRACKAIERACKAAPELWQIPAFDLTQLKSWFLYRFSVPLSDNITFVEQEDDASFDTIWLPRLKENFFERYEFRYRQDAWESAFAAFNPDNPGVFNRQEGHLYFNGQLVKTEDIFARRRKYMPALVFS